LLLFPLSVAYSLDKWRYIYLPSFKSNLENASIKHKVVIIPPSSRTVHEVDCYLSELPRMKCYMKNVDTIEKGYLENEAAVSEF